MVVKVGTARMLRSGKTGKVEEFVLQWVADPLVQDKMAGVKLLGTSKGTLFRLELTLHDIQSMLEATEKVVDEQRAIHAERRR